MNTTMARFRSRMKTTPVCIGLLLAASSLGLSGCNVDGFLDPTQTGRFEHHPTTIPILDRLDIIETEQDIWGQTTEPVPEDLIPNDLEYRTVPGDVVTVSIFELYAQGAWFESSRRIDAGGYYRIPELGDVAAAGLTAQEIEDLVRRTLIEQEIMSRPQVNVALETGSAFRYTVAGDVERTALYNLNDPDLRLFDALASAGGVRGIPKKIFVVRSIPLDESVKPNYQRSAPAAPSNAAPAGSNEEPVDIDDLIDNLSDDGRPSPGMMSQDGNGPVDIDDLQPGRNAQPAQVELQPSEDQPSFFYDSQRGEWVRVAGNRANGGSSGGQAGGEPPMIAERIIEIDYERLEKGDSSVNIVIRPNDRIFVQGGERGLVWIDGEVRRPGVYALPVEGALTLSRLVTTAGGLGEIAIPERVDLTRKVGDNREATIRLNLAAIRNRTEPDVLLKPGDHVIIGTNFWATPLAVIRNGFRMSYGFGFLLDRNFGNDVFGAPPRSGR